ncbi:hypothetical protein psal_cds_1338 [Pandoravirus salinus]|uniref:Uncharacterized protein n=1 Tax=Pandoravirus salinus TaxID=1349410 RepID=S4W4S5_9VIRU|nr:hypothetical protein psal_cds_1338 [Pandoravirus salinus]AGO85727.2 hypothetical protein psal_cds_1338 [Pandoravirus salinus]
MRLEGKQQRKMKRKRKKERHRQRPRSQGKKAAAKRGGSAARRVRATRSAFAGRAAKWRHGMASWRATTRTPAAP